MSDKLAELYALVKAELKLDRYPQRTDEYRAGYRDAMQRVKEQIEDLLRV